jgi:processing peptidase subunit alpha
MIDNKIMESIHEAAYNYSGLGLPLYAPVSNLERFTPDVLASYQAAFFTPKRLVVSGVGVEHQKLVELTNDLFGHLSSKGAQEVPKTPSVYTGGEIRLHRRDADSTTQFAIAFETSSWLDKDLVPMCVLNTLMGGGGSFSAGGPGKGMFSRLYTNVLNKYEWAELCTSFNSIHTDSGLFGIYGNSVAEKSDAMVDVIVKELHRMSGPVDAAELNRAKSLLKSSVFMQLESRNFKLEDIGRQLMTYGKVQTQQELAQLIDSVQPEDIQRVAKRMLSTPPTIAAAGNLRYIPSYDKIAKQFK